MIGKLQEKENHPGPGLIIILEASAAAEQIEKDSVIIEKEKAREKKQIDVAF